MMWLEDAKRHVLDDSDDDSASSDEEVPIWVRGEQRWVSGITADTTCHDVIQVLLQDEESRVNKPRQCNVVIALAIVHTRKKIYCHRYT